jgi:hypothetical protein
MSDLRHIHDPVLLSLKMEGIYYSKLFSGFLLVVAKHRYDLLVLCSHYGLRYTV